MSAAANPFAPSRGLYPVTKKPEDKTKDDFVRLVWRELTPDAFKNIGEFEEWFNKTLAPRTIESLGGAQVGGMLLRVTFPHGGMQHFMRWVMMKFTTTTSPEEAATAAAKAAEWDERTRELRKWKTAQPQGFIDRGRSYKKMYPDEIERWVPDLTVNRTFINRVDCVNEEPRVLNEEPRVLNEEPRVLELGPSRGLYPVTRKPSEDSETKAVFVPLVWGQITNNGVFSNIAEFKEWYKKIVRNIVSEFGEDPTLGLTAIEATFGGIKPFMTWVMTKFTTTTSPVAATATQRRRAQRKLKKQKTTKSPGFILPGRSVKKMCPDGVERYVPEERKKPKKRSAKEIEAMLEYGKTKVVISPFRAPEEQFALPVTSLVTRELLAPRNGTTMTIQDLSDFLTTTAFDALVEQLSGMPFSQKGWRQYLVVAFCRKKMTLSEENYEEEFQQNLREIKGRFGNWVIKNFTAPARPARTVAKKSKSPRWDIVEELRKGSAAYEDSVASAVQFVGDTAVGKSHKALDVLRLFRGELEPKPDHVVFENCTPEEVLLALWKETDVLGLGWLQQDGNPPTLEECREAANRGWVDYLKGKPIKIKFQNFPVLYRGEYEENAGKGKMQRVADMLRANGEGKTEGKTESDAPVTLSAAEPVVVAEVVEVIPLAEAVAVPVSEEHHAPMAPRAE